MHLNKVGLVLEGGGMRGVFTAGVLDFFLDENIEFPYVIGVSMGACNGASYIAKQKGRSLKTVVGYINDKRYLSYTNFIKTRNLFGMDFIFNEIPIKHVPFDQDTFDQSKAVFEIVASDCLEGKPIYFEKSTCENLNNALRASCSLPIISTIVHYEGKKLLDGAVTDSIPVERALSMGNEKLIIVLTRPISYRKHKSKSDNINKILYRKYPKLLERILLRYKDYNETLDYICKLEKEGRAFVIRPDGSLNIKRTEKDVEVLKQLYDLGYAEAKNKKEELISFIEN